MEKSHAKHLDFQQLIILDLAVQQLYLVFLVWTLWTVSISETLNLLVDAHFETWQDSRMREKDWEDELIWDNTSIILAKAIRNTYILVFYSILREIFLAKAHSISVHSKGREEVSYVLHFKIIDPCLFFRFAENLGETHRRNYTSNW